MCGEREQPRLLLGKHLGDRAVAMLRMRLLMCDLVTPPAKLRIEIVDIDKRAGGKEGLA
jgi:hypothetical protein